MVRGIHLYCSAWRALLVDVQSSIGRSHALIFAGECSCLLRLALRTNVARATLGEEDGPGYIWWGEEGELLHALADVVDPVLVLKVPLHSLLNPFLELKAGLPT